MQITTKTAIRRLANKVLCFTLAIFVVPLFQGSAEAVAAKEYYVQEYDNKEYIFEDYNEGFIDNSAAEIFSVIEDQSAELFSLTGSATRGEVVVLMVNALLPGALTSANAPNIGNTFSDVSLQHWFYPAIAWAYNRGWVTGDGTGRFNPNNPITREEFVTLAVRATGEPNGTVNLTFSDANQISSWALPSVKRAVQKGWVTGFPDNTFRPKTYITGTDAQTLVTRISGRTIAFPSNIKTITWNANGGTGGTTWQRIVGDVIGNPMPNVNITGDTSVGWFPTSSVTGGTRVTPLTIMPNSNTTYWARWPIWHDAETSYVGFWPGSINTYTQTLGSVSGGFQFTTRATEARTAWGNALGISISNTGTSSSAKIPMYGGTKAGIATFLNKAIGEIDWSGAAYPPTKTAVNVFVAMGFIRTVYQYSGQSRIFIVERTSGANWSQDDINRTKKTTTHELGHALGYSYHPARVTANNQDVMWYANHASYTLKANEKRHLRQIYDLYR